jgi:hypothetical protein
MSKYFNKVAEARRVTLHRSHVLQVWLGGFDLSL